MKKFVWWVRICQRENGHSSQLPPTVVYAEYEDAQKELKSWVEHFSSGSMVLTKDPTLDDVYYGNDKENGIMMQISIIGSPFVERRPE